MTNRQTKDGTPSSHSHGDRLNIGDWFVQGAVTEGSRKDQLAAVLQELTAKSGFVRALKERLADRQGADRLEGMSRKIQSLKAATRFRLGLLHVDREASWFRAPSQPTTPSGGLLGTSGLNEPVFAPYPPADADAIKSGLMQAWMERRDTNLPFSSPAPCLWRSLLQLRRELGEFCRLPAPYDRLSLARLPDELPSELESHALRAFLADIRRVVVQCEVDLGACYAELMPACEKFWAAQLTRFAQQHASTSSSEKGQSRSGAQGHARAESDSTPDQRQQTRDEHRRRNRQDAQQTRDQFAERRKSATKQPRTPGDAQALSFMGFEEFPTSEELRKRYLTLAKQMHPDHGGHEDSFKLLTKAYGHIAAKVGL